MKRIVVCDKYSRHITDEDFEKLKLVAPGLARMVKSSNFKNPTHFVCEKCGQVPPVTLLELHKCSE